MTDNLSKPLDNLGTGCVAHGNALSEKKQPKVSAIIITYNHVRFIAQAIESVLLQEVDFPVEIIIGDDCSTDGTRELVKAYAEKYPNVIRALLPAHNLGMGKNFRALYTACNGEFIALMDGDDYWSDPRKLQKQVAFMEHNPEFSMCGTAVSDVVMLANGQEETIGRFPEVSVREVFNIKNILLNVIKILKKDGK